MHAFPYSRIVAIDLGKFNSVLCVFDPANAAHAFASFASDRQSRLEARPAVCRRDGGSAWPGA